MAATMGHFRSGFDSQVKTIIVALKDSMLSIHELIREQLRPFIRDGIAMLANQPFDADAISTIRVLITDANNTSGFQVQLDIRRTSIDPFAPDFKVFTSTQCERYKPDWFEFAGAVADDIMAELAAFRKALAYLNTYTQPSPPQSPPPTPIVINHQPSPSTINVCDVQHDDIVIIRMVRAHSTNRRGWELMRVQDVNRANGTVSGVYLAPESTHIVRAGRRKGAAWPELWWTMRLVPMAFVANEKEEPYMDTLPIGTIKAIIRDPVAANGIACLSAEGFRVLVNSQVLTFRV